MNAQPQHVHGACVAALLRLGQSGIVAAAFTNNAAALDFWKGYTQAARDLIKGVGALAAANDALTRGNTQTDLQAAGACLPERTKDLTLVQVRKILAAQGIEVATDAISHADISAGEVLEHHVVARIDGNDEHSIARVHVSHCPDGHGSPSEKKGAASLDQSEPKQEASPEALRAESAAIKHVLRQMQRDPRLAWLIGPGSRTYELLTEEAAQAAGQPLETFRTNHEATLSFSAWPRQEGGEQ